ncbi:enoyl-CoA hydratase/isomerase family protein [Aeromicrobium sp. UC242_57]
MRINRPLALNAISSQVGQALSDAFAAADHDPTVRAIVVTGTGTRAFSAGADLKEMAAGGQVAEQSAQIVSDMLRHRPNLPVIAAVNGLAYGGGFELVLACDLAVCSTHAEFALPEVSRGIVAGGGGLVRLPHLVGPRRAMSLALTGEPIDADQALQWGVVNEVVPPAQVLDAALRLAATVAQHPRATTEASKLAIRDAARATPPFPADSTMTTTKECSDDRGKAEQTAGEGADPRGPTRDLSVTGNVRSSGRQRPG